MPEDREIWSRILKRDEVAFDLFYNENAPRLRSFLHRIVGNRQAAEDLMQETFTQIWNRPNSYDPERGALRVYLFGIGRKRAAEWWRKQKSSDSSTEESASECRTELHSLVDDAFRRLPEDQRALLWLREVEGQSYDELGATLGIPLGTVRSRLFTAREALRKIWHAGKQNLEGERHDVR